MKAIEKLPFIRKDVAVEWLSYLILKQILLGLGFKLIHQGKVRDTWYIPFPGYENYLLIVATDGISIFDFVFSQAIPRKGEALTALTHFSLTKILPDIKNHLVSSDYFTGANKAYDLRKDFVPQLPIERCLVVKNYSGQVLNFEMIHRDRVGGSPYPDYLKTGIFCGYKIEPNLPQWSKLSDKLFTPSTKEEVGHDVNVTAEYFFNATGDIGRKAAQITGECYERVFKHYENVGIELIDTKLEVAVVGNEIIIVDETFTCDSSRFGKKEDVEAAVKEKRDPIFYDKQLVREWGKKVETPFGAIGINNITKTSNKIILPEHINFVHSLTIPPEIVAETTKRYLQVCEWAFGKPLDEYQREMGVLA